MSGTWTEGAGGQPDCTTCANLRDVIELTYCGFWFLVDLAGLVLDNAGGSGAGGSGLGEGSETGSSVLAGGESGSGLRPSLGLSPSLASSLLCAILHELQ